MKNRSPLTHLAIIGIAAILLMQGPLALSVDGPPHEDPTGGNDFLLGSDAQDIIDGLEGNDIIFGFSSSDILDGSGGDDVILGGESSDRIRGGDDKDFLHGGKGADKMFGGKGNDQMFGGGQGDRMDGDEGDDEMYGGDQSDVMFGGPGNDVLSGGPGSDNIFGGPGDDTIYGGAKNDNLFAGDGVDELFGGTGNDHLIGSIVGQATLDGGEFDDDFDGLFNEDPFDPELDDDGNLVFIDNDGDGLFDEDGPGNDNDVCFWDGGPTRLINLGLDGVPGGVGDDADVFGDDVLVFDDGPDGGAPTCERIHVLGLDQLSFGQGKKGGGGKEHPPSVLSASFVETTGPPTLAEPEPPKAGTLTLSFNKDVDTTDPEQDSRLGDALIGTFGVGLFPQNGQSFVPSKTDDFIVFTLDQGAASIILAFNRDIDTAPTYTVHANVFKDKFNNGNEDTLLAISVDEKDYDAPEILGASYVPASGVLTVGFNEEIDPLSVVESSIFVRERADNSNSVTLGGTTNIMSAGTTIVITVSEAQRLLINGIPEPIELDVLAGAFSDVVGIPILSTSNTPITVLNDTVNPFILSATFDESFGNQAFNEPTLTITFNEVIDATPTSNIDLTKVKIGGSGGEVVLTGATVNNLVDGNPITITVTPDQLAGINALGTTLALAALDGAFVDLSANPIVGQAIPLALTPTDVTSPVIVYANFDETFGVLKVGFDERIDTTPSSLVDLTKVFFSESGGVNENVLDDGVSTPAVLTTTSDDAEIVIALTATQITDLLALTSPELDVSLGAVIDKNNNPVVDTPDTPIIIIPTDLTKPLIQSVAYVESTGVLTITFDEPIDAGSVDLEKVFVSKTKKKNQIELIAATSVISVGNTIVITVAEADRLAINALSSHELDVGKNAFTDLAGNKNDKSENTPITVTP